LRINNLLSAINALTQNKASLPLQIQLSSGNLLNVEQTQEVLRSLPFLLETIGLLRLRKRGEEEYYCVHETTLTNRSADMSKLTSLIFYTNKVEQRAIRRELSRIKNMAIKEGFQLWA
jgi:hypothetical protein